ncbi:hypothetical protein A3E39_00255 [Candidatus Uhrbacteria bacterium RIFCSPHIGHO2_12_FULL_60_25]|uniref:Uncharacterized protein n=1 Tax=Candidatus Uhrbacteria bacterium RIFCSPHIGHO2_12_FULL_60_25 TaxID=1802399 RepID=A0A1F7UKN1_9BACT|nr:MAG: hypothetical protein A3D73_00235 [Candidatus Uhrbacteria bacterium RIFCSPHIGHO2_02_FULL_60_44]OGL78846.1 MAG: hypothetical protein A3E39_00255 [Candidatus Uhrbacteria bacterium RIFCSPHIGHO2_12_FULL_60_25]
MYSQTKAVIVRLSTGGGASRTFVFTVADDDAPNRLWQLVDDAAWQRVHLFISNTLPLEGIPFGPAVLSVCPEHGANVADGTCLVCRQYVGVFAPSLVDIFPDDRGPVLRPDRTPKIVVVTIHGSPTIAPMFQTFVRAHSSEEARLMGAVKAARADGVAVDAETLPPLAVPLEPVLARLCAECGTRLRERFCGACGRDLRDALPFVADGRCSRPAKPTDLREFLAVDLYRRAQ